ncbi:MAG: WecB/TagA/CpsF family glycosyltransferase [Bacteroidota bacterium]
MPIDPTSLPSVQVLNVKIHNLSLPEWLEVYEEGVLFTPNIDHLMKLQKDEDFFRTYQQADFKSCDSRIIMAVSSFFFGEGFKAQIAGSDFFPAFCDYHKENQDVKVFLLGGTASSVQAAAKKLNQSSGRKLVTGFYSPPFGFEHNPSETAKIYDMILTSGATVLAVGVGAPKQEHWIIQHKDRLPSVKCFMAIGKTIDFIAGETQRAPAWISKIGMEWFYRMLQEPGRLAKRYLVDDMPFFYYAFLQKIGRYTFPFSK